MKIVAMSGIINMTKVYIITETLDYMDAEFTQINSVWKNEDVEEK